MSRSRPVDRGRLALAGVILAAVIALAVSSIATPTARSSSTQECWPSAQVPEVLQQYSIGRAHAYIEYCSSAYVLNLYLINRAGNTLRHDAWYVPAGYGWWHPYGSWTGCAGAYVHTELYMDIGISDRSGENLSCAY
jgi:hypothetical protein